MANSRFPLRVIVLNSEVTASELLASLDRFLERIGQTSLSINDWFVSFRETLLNFSHFGFAINPLRDFLVFNGKCSQFFRREDLRQR